LKKDGLQTLILHTGLMTYLLLTTNFFNLTSPWRIFHVNLDTSKRILSKQARSAAFRNYLYIARVGLTQPMAQILYEVYPGVTPGYLA